VFERLVEAGKVRAYRTSTDSLEVLQKFNRDGNCAICQLNYSILRRDAEAVLLPYCLENNIGTLICGPLAQAALQFILAHPAVTCPIPGAKNLAQIDANAAAADGELSDDELRRIDEIAK
jgi:aryl-alcohol dehydrogenase-like predicted oxidoreductase